MNVALLTAAGSGTRMNQDIPKQFIHVDNKPVIIYTLEAFQNHPGIDAIIVVTIESWSAVLWAYAKQFNITKLKWVVPGGKSGQESIFNGLKKLKEELSDEDVGKVYQEFRRVIRKRGTLTSVELEAIIATAAMQVPSTFHVVNYVVNSGNVLTATANITLEKNGETLAGVSMGDGPIDAAFHAIEGIIGHHYELDDFQIGAVTKGREAVGNAIVRLRSGGKLYSGNGVSTDIIGASIRAYINALNKIVYEEK